MLTKSADDKLTTSFVCLFLGDKHGKYELLVLNVHWRVARPAELLSLSFAYAVAAAKHLLKI